MADNDARLPDDAELDDDTVVSRTPASDDVPVRGPYDDKDEALAGTPIVHERAADAEDSRHPNPGIDGDGEGDQVDLPGELLASDDVPAEVDAYEVDDAEAEELTGPRDADPLTTNEAGEPVDDPVQLAEAETEARVAPSSRPRKRKQRRAEEAIAAAAAAEADDSTPLVREAGSLRPKRRGSTAATVATDVEDADEPLSTRPGVRKHGSAVVAKKDHATPRRHDAVAQRTADPQARRVGPVGFVGEVVAELRKVVWPTGSQLAQYFVVVLVFVLFIIALVFGLDTLFGYLTLKIFG